MQRRTSQRPVAVALMLVAGLPAAAAAAAESTTVTGLTPLPLVAESVTVSGVSSGGAMAVQFHTAHANLVQGAGVLAAPPYFCAQGSIGHALGRCMKDGAAIPVAELLQHADRLAAAGAIDPAAAMATDRVWLYHGAADPHVHVTVVDALERYYRARVPPGNLARVDREGAGHNYPTARAGGAPCSSSDPPYVASCDYDAPRQLLEHLYGPLAPNAASPALASLRTFDQRPYAEAARSVALADQGWLYVPASCDAGADASCRLHVVFHGCRQGSTEVGDTFARQAGYLEVADANRIVVLFPQVKPTTQPLNPLGCWDWWGYEGAGYETRDSRQVRAVRAMVDALLGGPREEPGDARTR